MNTFANIVLILFFLLLIASCGLLSAYYVMVLSVVWIVGLLPSYEARTQKTRKSAWYVIVWTALCAVALLALMFKGMSEL